MAYEIVKRLQGKNDTAKPTPDLLATAVVEREKKKSQLHVVFKNSFDAKLFFPG